MGSLVWTLIVILLRKRNILLHKFQPNSAFSHYTSQTKFDFVFFFLIVCLTVFDYRSFVDLCVRNMDSKGDDGSREMLLKLQEKIEKATSELKASGSSSSASTSSHHLQRLSKEVQLLLDKTVNAQVQSKPQIRDGNNLFNT